MFPLKMSYILCRKVVFLSLLFCVIQKVNANNRSVSGVPFSVSYYGNSLVNPGLKLSADFIWIEFSKLKTKKNGKVKNTSKKLLTTPYLSFYRHHRSHQGFQLGTDVLWRRINNKGWYREIGLGLGYLQRHNLGDTWEVNNGTLENLKGAYRGYFSQTFSLAKGKLISIEGKGDVIPFLRFNADFISNYNSFSIPVLSIELGVRFTPSFSPNRGHRLIEKTNKNDEK